MAVTMMYWTAKVNARDFYIAPGTAPLQMPLTSAETKAIQPGTMDDYNKTQPEIELLQKDGKGSQDHVKSFRWLLNPIAFARFARLKDDNHQMHVKIAHSILPHPPDAAEPTTPR